MSNKKPNFLDTAHAPFNIGCGALSKEENSFAGLEETPRADRPTRLDGESTLQALHHDLRQSSREFGYTQNLWDGKLLSHHLLKRFGVHLGVQQCQRLFQQLEFRRRKPHPLIAKSDPEAQRKYKKIHRLTATSDLNLWSEDECHFQQHRSRCTVLIPPENIDLVVLHAPTRKSVGVFSAVHIDDGRLFTNQEDKFNAMIPTAFNVHM